MPFFRKIDMQDIQMFVWKITESETDLYCPLSEQEKQRFELLKSYEDRKRFLAVRQLFQKAQIPFASVYYNAKGKPFLSDGFISVSHSNQYAVVALSRKPIGVDIEKIQYRMFEICHKFTTWIPPNNTLHNLEKLTKIWTAKEALYKATSLLGISLKEHLWAEDFDYTDTQSVAQIKYHNNTEQYKVFWQKFDNFVCCCVCKEF